MKNTILILKGLLLFAILFWTPSKVILAQPCLQNGITLSSQSQIDNFATDYPACSQILGDLIIEESMDGDITNLLGLSSVISVQGNLYVARNTSLSSLSGLESITSVGESFAIYACNILPNLIGLESLALIGGNVTVAYNPILTNLNGLDNLNSIGGGVVLEGNTSMKTLNGLEGINVLLSDLVISYNYELISLSGLEYLDFVGGNLDVRHNSILLDLKALKGLDLIGRSLIISDNAKITSLSGLDQISHIGEYLAITDNQSLTSLTGLENLTSIEGNLSVSNNAVLPSLRGLDNLHTMGRRLTVRNNAVLSSLSGLENLDHSTITNLTITECPNLSMCELECICNYIDDDGEAIISGNAFGCNSESEIESACLVPVQELQEDGQAKFDIYPNPTNGIIYIEGPNMNRWSIGVWNTSGRLNVDQLIENGRIDLSHVPAGLIFLKMKNKNKLVIRKIIKQ